jgi:hypothetical protein
MHASMDGANFAFHNGYSLLLQSQPTNSLYDIGWIQEMITTTEQPASVNHPEVSLWVAVLEQAIADLADHRRREAALLWFRSTRKSIGSFAFVAEALNQCPKRLRRHIFSSLRQPVPHMRLAA